MSWEEKLGWQEQLQREWVNDLQARRIVSISGKEIRWDTDTDFNKGDYNNTEVNGTSTDAVIQLEENIDNDDNIEYNVLGNYTLSDDTKITVDENDGNKASLKILSGGEKTYPFNIPSNYTYDTDYIEVTGGVGKLKDLRPTDATFYTNMTNSSANWGDGSLVGVLRNGATIASGLLDVSGAVGRCLDFDSTNNADIPQMGCIRMGYIPQYTGNPSDYQLLFFLGTDGTFQNSIYLFHDPTGLLYLAMYDTSSNLIMAHNMGAWSPTSGTEYEFEANYNISTGATRVFIDGIQKGTTATQTGTHNNFNIIRIGNNYSKSLTSNFKVNYTLIFDTVQHTANYTPAGQSAITSTIYSTNDNTIESNTGFAFTTSLDTFTEFSTKPTNTELKYQISSDDGTTFKWWNSAWVARTLTGGSALATAISTDVGTPTGSLSNILSLDGNTYDVVEVTGNPGFNINIDFDDVGADVNRVTVYGYYNGNPSHTVQMQIYNFDTTIWDVLGTFPNASPVIVQHDFIITGTLSDYRDSNGDVKTRIRHTSNGSSGHDMVIDYIYLRLDDNPTDTWYYDNESNLASVVQTNIGSLAGSGTFQFNTFLNSNGDVTPELSGILVGEPTTYSTTDNLYIDTKDTSQIAPVTIISWLTETVTSLMPTNTNIRLMFSTDGRTSWKTWSGSAWVTPTLATERQYATELVDAGIFFNQLPKGDGTLDVRLFLYTSDNSVSPFVDNINVTSDTGYSSSGIYTSNSYETAYPYNNEYYKITFITDIPTGTTMTIKTRTSEDGITWTDWSSAYSTGDDITQSGKYIQWKADLTGGDLSPSLDILSIYYTTPSTGVINP